MACFGSSPVQAAPVLAAAVQVLERGFQKCFQNCKWPSIEKAMAISLGEVKERSSPIFTKRGVSLECQYLCMQDVSGAGLGRIGKITSRGFQ